MKRSLLLLAFAVLLLVLVGCSGTHYSSSYRATLLVHSNRSGSAFMRFSGFDGRMVFHMKSAVDDTLVCDASLKEGNATVYYDNGGTKTEIFSIRGGDQIHADVPHLKSGKVYVIVETDGKCSDGNFEFKVEK